MNRFNTIKEWEFIRSEVTSWNARNVPYLIRELLFVGQIILQNYSDSKSRRNKYLYKSIYIETKNFYLGCFDINE